MEIENKVLIIVPTDGGVHEMTTAAITNIVRTHPDVDVMIAKGRPHDYARNCAVRMFLQHNHTHLLFIDSDTEPPQDVVDRLLAHRAPVVTGCYPVAMTGGLMYALTRRDADGAHHCLEHLDFPDQPFAVDGCGAGCLLIRRDVLIALDWPWFRWVERPDGHQTGEDIFFADRCRDAGIPILADPTVKCRHYKRLDLLALTLIKQMESQ